MEQLPSIFVAGVSLDVSDHVVTVPCCGGNSADRDQHLRHHSMSCGIRWLRRIVSILEKKIVDNKVVRLLLYRQSNLNAISQAMPLLLAHIRRSQWPVVVMIAMPPPIGHTPENVRVRTLLQGMADVVLFTEGHAVGSLHWRWVVRSFVRPSVHGDQKRD